jgi:hypothetical protein
MILVQKDGSPLEFLDLESELLHVLNALSSSLLVAILLNLIVTHLDVHLISLFVVLVIALLRLPSTGFHLLLSLMKLFSKKEIFISKSLNLHFTFTKKLVVNYFAHPLVSKAHTVLVFSHCANYLISLLYVIENLG